MNESNPAKPKGKVKRVLVVPTDASHPRRFSYSQTKSLHAASTSSSRKKKCKRKITSENMDTSEATFIEREDYGDDDSVMKQSNCYNISRIIHVNEAKRTGKDKNNSAAEAEAVKNDEEDVSNDYDILSVTASLEKDDESTNATESSKTESKKDEIAVETAVHKIAVKGDSNNYNIRSMHAFERTEKENNNINNVSQSSIEKNKVSKSGSISSKAGSKSDKSPKMSSKSESKTVENIDAAGSQKEIKAQNDSAASKVEYADDRTGSELASSMCTSEDIYTSRIANKSERDGEPIPAPKVKPIRGRNLISQILTTLKVLSFRSEDGFSAVGGVLGRPEVPTKTDQGAPLSSGDESEIMRPKRTLNLERGATVLGRSRRYSGHIHGILHPMKEVPVYEDSDTFSFMNIPETDNDEGLQVYFGERKFESRLEEQMSSVMKLFHSNFFEFYVKNQFSLVPYYVGITLLKLSNVLIEYGVEILGKRQAWSKEIRRSAITLLSLCGVETCIFFAVLLTVPLIKRKAMQSTWFRHSCPVILFCYDLFTVLMCLHFFDTVRNEKYVGTDNGWCVPTVFLNIVLLPCSVTISSLLSVTVFAAHVMKNSVDDTRLDFFSKFSKVSVVTWNYLCSFILGFAVKHLCQHTISHGYDECKKIYRRQEEILADTQRQEYLLKTILPPMVATEIIKTINAGAPSKDLALFKKPYMSKFDDVSILFADVVGFTVISSNLKAKDLVSLLDVLYLRFDALSDKYDVLRIEIAGDCYIAVCGTEKACQDHAQMIVRMAMGMVDVMGTVNEVLLGHGYKWNLDLRIGINSGDVVGGVVGRYRWRFDVVGRNVCLANQMESSGEPGRIHITEFTHLRLPATFHCVRGPDYRFNYDEDTKVVKTFFVESVEDSYQESKERRRSRSRRSTRGGSDFMHRQTALDHTIADVVHLEVYNTVSMSKFFLRFHSTEIEKTFQRLRIKNSIHDLYLTAVVFGLRYCGTMMQVRVVNNLALSNCIIFVLLILISFFSFIPNDSYFIRYSSVRFIRRELCRNPLFRLFIILLIVGSTLANIFINNASQYCKILGRNMTFNSSSVDKFHFTSMCRTANDLHLMTIMHLISLQSVRECSVLGAVVYLVISYTLLILYVRKSNEVEVEAAYMIILESWIYMFILLLAFYVIKLEFRKTFAWRWNVQCSLFRAQWARQTNQALMRNIFPIHVATFFYYQEEGKVQYSQQHEMVAVMFASIMNAKDNLRLRSTDDTLEWLQLLHSIITEIDQFLDWPYLEPVTKMKTLGPMYMAASGLKVTNPEKNSEALVAMCEFGLAIIDLIEDLNRDPGNMLATRIGINIGPVYAGVICHHRPHYDIWGNTVNVASRMESHGVTGCVQVTTRTMLILHRISNYDLVRRGKIQVKGKGEMVTYFVKRQTGDGRKESVADTFL